MRRMPPDDAAPVITGMGIAASLGLDPESVWQAIISATTSSPPARVGMGPIPIIEQPLPEGATGGQAADLPTNYCPSLSREPRYLRWAIEQALHAAALPSASRCYPPTRCAVILGTTLHGIRAGGRFLRTSDPQHLADFLANSTLAAAIRGLGIQGPTLTTCSACSSSLCAIASGITLLQSGQADLVVAGGYDAIGEYVWGGFNSLRLVSPSTVRPFAKNRDGMKVAEGFGIVILERAADAARRSAPVLARLEGWGESSDAHHLTKPHPEGRGAAQAMHAALARAAAVPQDINLVAAHATATPDNDAAEFQALRTFLGHRLPETPVVGFKSYLGHTLGGAGVVELILSIKALHAGWVPPTANVLPHDSDFSGLCLAPPGGLLRPLTRTLNTSLGFGGANACLIAAHPDAPPPPPRPSRASPAPEAWITGIGVLLPGISSIQALVDQLASGPTFLFADHGTIDDAQLAQVMNIRRARRFGLNVKLLLAAATSALDHARIDSAPPALEHANAILASTHGAAGFCSEYYQQIVREGILVANPVLFAEGVPNAAAAHLSTTFGIRGGCQTLIGARTAGLDALALAALRIQTGAADLVIVGASEETHDNINRAYIAQVLHRASPSAPGFVATPAAVAFIVESSTTAPRRGARPLARISGYASAGHSPGGPALAIASALRTLASTAPVVGSANGTWIDRAEALALRRARLTHLAPSLNPRIGETFSAGPLLNIAFTLATQTPAAFTALCTDYTGAASAIAIEPNRVAPGHPPLTPFSSGVSPRA
jgi:3-oxoacyl-[acyl-carrier-protein] synthase II